MTTFTRSAISAAVANLTPIAAKRSPSEVLRFLRLEASHGTAVVRANNTECMASIAIECSGDMAPVLIDAQKCNSFLSMSRGDNVELSTTKSGVQLVCGSGKLSLASPSPAEFPVFGLVDDDAHCKVVAEVLLGAIRRGSVFADESEVKFAMGGTCITFEENRITLASTNSRAMAFTECAGKTTGQISQSIVPKAFIPILDNMLSGRMGEVTVRARNVFQIEGPKFTFACRLIDGRFPRLQEHIDYRYRNSATVQAGELSAGVRQAALMKGPDDSCGVDFEFREHAIALSSPQTEQGQSACEVPCANDGVKHFRLDHRYVMAALKTIEPEVSVKIENNDKNGPVKLSTDQGHLFVCMPMVLGDT